MGKRVIIKGRRVTGECRTRKLSPEVKFYFEGITTGLRVIFLDFSLHQNKSNRILELGVKWQRQKYSVLEIYNTQWCDGKYLTTSSQWVTKALVFSVC